MGLRFRKMGKPSVERGVPRFLPTTLSRGYVPPPLHPAKVFRFPFIFLPLVPYPTTLRSLILFPYRFLLFPSAARPRRLRMAGGLRRAVRGRVLSDYMLGPARCPCVRALGGWVAAEGGNPTGSTFPRFRSSLSLPCLLGIFIPFPLLRFPFPFVGAYKNI